MLALWKKSYDKTRQHIKKQRHHISDKATYSQSYVLCNSHVYMWELDHREGWGLKNLCFWTVVLKKTLDFLGHKEIKSVNPKGNQPGRTDAEAEAPVLWAPDAKSWFIWKDLDAVKDWGQEEKGAAEDELVGWHHQLNGHEFVQDPGDSEVKEGLTSCSLWGCKESDKTETEQQQK